MSACACTRRPATAAETTGPMNGAGSAFDAPMVSLPATSTKRLTKASPSGVFCTIKRRAQVQRWPAEMKVDDMAMKTAASVSLASHTTSGLLPPISSASILPGWPPNCLCSAAPVCELPVKSTPSISVFWPSATPVSRPPLTRLTTPAGTPACCHICTVLMAVRGAYSLGLKMTVFPAISAGTIWPFGRWPGKLYGPKTPKTPCGRWRSTASPSATLLCDSPVRALCDCTEISTLLAIVVTSVRDSHSGLPTSAEISSASSSAFSFSRSRKRAQMAMRSASGVNAHASNAAWAASQARATSCAVDSLLAQVCLPFDGSMVTSSAPLPASHSPLMKLLKTLDMWILPQIKGQRAHRIAGMAVQELLFGFRQRDGAVDRHRLRQDHAEILERGVRHQHRFGGDGFRRAGRIPVRRQADFGQRAFAHGPQFRHARLQHRAGVEDVDVALEVQAFLLQQAARRRGRHVDLADHLLRVFRQVGHVQRLARHQFGDEGLLADSGQVVDVVEVHLEEVAAQAFVERRTAALLLVAAHFGDQLFGEQVRELGDEQEAALRQQLAVVAGAVVRRQEQRTQFGAAGQVVRQVQRVHAGEHIELAAGVHQRADAIVVERLRQADRALDRAHAGDAAVVGVLHDEHVVALFGRDGLGERGDGDRQAVAHHLHVRLEGGHAAADLRGHHVQGVEVVGGDCAYY